MIKTSNLLLMSAALTCAACGGAKSGESTTEGNLIERSNIRIENRRMTPEALWAMGRIGSVAVSPDAKRLAYSVAYYSIEQNKSNNELFVMNADGSDNLRLTRTGNHESSPAWTADGRIVYLSSESGSSQVWSMKDDGTDHRQLTRYEGDIEGFSISPDGKKMLFISQVKTVPSTADKHPDLPKATGLIVEDLMYKHWDEWTTTAPHPFVADFDSRSLTNIKDILTELPYESPMKPWGGIEQLAWSPASDKVAFTCRMKKGLAYALSTDSDIYEYDIKSGSVKNLCKDGDVDMEALRKQAKADNALIPAAVAAAGLAAQTGRPSDEKNFGGYDTNPQYSPDGKYIAWQSMERDGYEADLNRLCIMDRTTGEKRFVSTAFDSNVDAFLWTADSKAIYFMGVWHGKEHIYHLDLTQGNKLTQVTDGQYDYASIALCGNDLIAKRHSMSEGDEIYRVNTEGQATQLTRENKHIYDQLDMGRVEERWMKTTDGKQMLTWVIYPPKFDPNKKYPTLLFCEGGPQSPVSQFWSYRWNFQIMAANDYIIVAPNRRGLPGFGHEWNEAISGDYGGQCMRDYFTAIDEMTKEPFVDKDRLGCVGASFGGFSVYWLAGHHDKRFKAFIAHDGIFNMEMQYLETEEKWFANWDMGGAYWEKDNRIAQRTFANSPHKFVDKWDAPILCIHGEKDFRILGNQAMAAFDAAVLRGVPAQLLIYPDENHWVLKPQNGVLWQRTFFEWLDKWLKK